jgi:hypothetical protein
MLILKTSGEKYYVLLQAFKQQKYKSQAQLFLNINCAYL